MASCQLRTDDTSRLRLSDLLTGPQAAMLPGTWGPDIRMIHSGYHDTCLIKRSQLKCLKKKSFGLHRQAGFDTWTRNSQRLRKAIAKCKIDPSTTRIGMSKFIRLLLTVAILVAVVIAKGGLRVHNDHNEDEVNLKYKKSKWTSDADDLT